MNGKVTLRYHRPPDRTDVFVQELLYADDDVLVTYLAETPLRKPLVIGGRAALEPGAPAVWFTFPALMHDIGRFHTANGDFTGLYANVLEPVTIHSLYEWSATDLFLDFWVGTDGATEVLDRDELEHATARGWISEQTAARARAEADWLAGANARGEWPPPVVNDWTLERVLLELGKRTEQVER